MSEKILIVDDDDNILNAYKRRLRKRFTLETVNNSETALVMIRETGPYAVVLSDYQMPGMDGIEFLSQVRGRSPDTVRMILTGYADLKVAMEAVNEGHVFRFLTKPCNSDVLALALEAGLEQYRLIQNAYELRESKRIEETLREAGKRLEQEVEARTKDLLDSNEQLKAQIVERSKAEKALRESREVLTQVIDNIPNCIYWKDADSVYIGCNANFLNFIDIEKSEDLIGKTDRDLGIDKEFADFLYESAERVMSLNIPEFHAHEMFNAQGEITTLDIGMIPYHDDEGTVIGMICIMEDVSSKIKAEEERIRLEKNNGISKIADVIADELNFPLKNLKRYKQLINNVSKENPLYDYFINIEEQVDLISQITKKLKSYAEPQ